MGNCQADSNLEAVELCCVLAPKSEVSNILNICRDKGGLNSSTLSGPRSFAHVRARSRTFAPRECTLAHAHALGILAGVQEELRRRVAPFEIRESALATRVVAFET
jgi:hypothetical protein